MEAGGVRSRRHICWKQRTYENDGFRYLTRNLTFAVVLS